MGRPAIAFSSTGRARSHREHFRKALKRTFPRRAGAKVRRAGPKQPFWPRGSSERPGHRERRQTSSLGGRFSRPTPRSPFLDGRGRTAIASARRDPRESAICRILRCFEAVFQKGNLSKNRPEIISRVPHEGKGLYNPGGTHRGRREKKGGDKSCAPL